MRAARRARTLQALGLVCLAALVRGQAVCPNKVLTRAAAAAPQHTPAAIASLATRGLASSRPASDSTVPAISATGGRQGVGAFEFDRSKRQYLDGGGLKMDVSRGFTLVAMVSLAPPSPSASSARDVLFEFFDADLVASFRFVINRSSNTFSVGFIEEEYENNCFIQSSWDVEDDDWKTIAVRLHVDLDEMLTSLSVEIDGDHHDMDCFGRLSFAVYETLHVGGSPIGGQYMHGRIQGLYAVDRSISDSTVQRVADLVSAGEDVLQLCALVPCSAGTAGPLGKPPCADCAPGKFQESPGRTACVNCTAGQFSAAEGADEDVCQTCPALSSAPASGAGATCVCDAGAAGAAGGACTPCLAGTFTASAGQAACAACPANFSSVAGGATACVPCRPFSSSPAAHAGACACWPGYGEYEVAGARACVACPSGTWTHGGFGACSGCLLRADNCDTCNETVLVAGTGQCEEPVRGSYAKNVALHNGSMSYSKADGSHHIYRQGTVWYMGYHLGVSHMTARCRVDSATLPLHPWEERCGHWTANQMTVARTVHETAACYPRCLLGRTWHAARARCVQCAPAHYKDWNGTAPCARCPPGADTGAASGSTSASACVCPAGFEFASASASVCSPCAPGSARPASAARSAMCAACPAGRYAARAGAAACKMCPAGFFAAAGGAAGCQQCPEGEAASANRTGCQPVPGAAAPCATPRVRVGVAALPAFVRVDAGP